jgi:hypothetical protein
MARSCTRRQLRGWFSIHVGSVVSGLIGGCTQAAVKMHTLLDLRGRIPSFIHVSDGKLHDVHALDLVLLEA